jgi:hypothetical protein
MSDEEQRVEAKRLKSPVRVQQAEQHGSEGEGGDEEERESMCHSGWT